MSALSDYLMKHHLSAMSNNDTVLNAALEVIKAQDEALDEARKIMLIGRHIHADIFGFTQWLEKYPK